MRASLFPRLFQFCLLTIIAMPWATAFAQEHPAADTIITNANAWTVDRNHPQAEAVAILNQRIVAVGTSVEMDGWRGSRTRIIDAGGKLLLPGFNDAHVHFVSGGFQLDQVQLTDAKTHEEFVRRIAAQAKKLKKGEWILGGEWDEQNWSPVELPTHEWIDAATPDNPVFIERHDGHESLANALAMKLANVTADTKAPAGGDIVRDPKGSPTGIFKDAAQALIGRAIPEPTPAARIKAAKRALEYAASLGVTSLQDMVPAYGDIEAYAVLAERGELTARIYAAPTETRWRDQARIGVRRAFGSEFLRIGAVKGFADGSLGSTTAYFFQPYVDAPNSRGLLSDEMQPVSAMRERLTGADKAGLELCIHAIGDEAISTVLDIFQDIQKANGSRDRRWRIEHAQHMAPKDFQRFANLRAYLAFMWTHPGKKLLFMGGEFAHEREWNHDIGLDWQLLGDPLHRGVHRLVRDLNHLYRSTPALHQLDCEPDGFHWIDVANAAESTVSYLRRGRDPQEQAVIVCNFTPVPRHGYRIGVPLPGRYRERINTDAQEYGGSGVGNAGEVHADPHPMHGHAYSLSLNLPPLGTLIFTHD